MSFNESGDDAEYTAAVAATAFAISSLESDNVNQRDLEGPQTSLPRIRSTIVDTIAAMTDLGEALKNSAGEKKAKDSEKYENFDKANAERNEMIPKKTIHPVPPMKRTPTKPKKKLSFADLSSIGRTPTSEKTPTFDEEQFENEGRIRPPRRIPTFDEEQFEDEGRIRPPKRTSTIKKTPALGEDGLEDAERNKPEISAPRTILPSPILPPPIPPLTIQPAVPPKGAQRPRDQEMVADAWEREEMAKIKQRYEKLNATILEWEDRKRKKAKHKLEMTEVCFEPNHNSSGHKIRKATLTMICLQEPQSERQKRRAKARQRYQADMEQIKQIADGARAQAKEKHRNDELKVKEKANRYRTTGEPPLPPICLCL